MIFTEKKIITILSGEYYISNDPQVVIVTLLGSCIAVCLFDPLNGVGGMNHFMLPQAQKEPCRDYGKFGLQSLEMMLEGLAKQGAAFANLKAKVFGGSNMINLTYKENGIAIANIHFTLKYLQNKNIPIISKELGGNIGRRIYYLIEDHSVFVQRLSREGK